MRNLATATITALALALSAQPALGATAMASSFADRATVADRSSWQRTLDLGRKALRIDCRDTGQHVALCSDAAHIVWAEGAPASWVTWTDSVYLHGHALEIASSGAEVAAG